MAINPPSTADLNLPTDLVAFLATGRPRSEDDAHVVKLQPIADLVVEPIHVEPAMPDFLTPAPLPPQPVAGPVPMVKLAAITGGDYDPIRLLVWIPESRRYGIWDSADHSLRTFKSEVSWDQIVISPSKFLGSGTNAEIDEPAEPATFGAINAGQVRLDAGHVNTLRRLTRMRNRDRAIIVGMALVGLLIGLLYVTSPPPAISVETYEQIQIGMSEREVERIVRARPGYYSGSYDYVWLDVWRASGHDASRYGLEWLVEGDSGIRELSWASNDGYLRVDFDDEGRVRRKRLVHLPTHQPTHPEKWPWWKRLMNRSRPADGPTLVFISF